MYSGMLPILYVPILSDLGLTYTQLGMIISVHLFTLGFMQFGSSILSRFIPKRMLLGLGTILLGIGGFAVGISQSFSQILMGRVIGAVGGSPQHPVGTALIVDRFEDKLRGSALGIHFSLSFIGNIFGPIAAGILLIYLGWRLTLHIFAIPAFIVGFMVIFLIKEKVVINKDSTSRSIWIDIKNIFRNKIIVLLFVAQLFASGAGQGVLLNYAPLILTDSLGMAADSTERLFYYIVLLTGGVAGPIIIGRLSDILNRRIVGLFTPITSAIMLYLFITSKEPNIFLIPILLLLGINSFAIPIIIQAILSDAISGPSRDVALGLYYTLTFTFSAVWVGAIGYLTDIYLTFTPVMTAASLSIMFTTFFLYLGSSRLSPISKTYNKV
jgi:MFS family permease